MLMLVRVPDLALPPVILLAAVAVAVNPVPAVLAGAVDYHGLSSLANLIVLRLAS